MGFLGQNKSFPILRQLGGVGFVGPLDAYAADLQVALLPFRGFTAYTGQWCRIRESGGDTEADIGYLANGQPDTAAWTAHVAGNSGFLRTWYDQSGSARDGVQATNAGQLQSVLNVANSYPVARNPDDGSNKAITCSSVVSGSGVGRTLYTVMRKRSAQTGAGVRTTSGVATTSAFICDNAGAPALNGGWAWNRQGVATQLPLGGNVEDWTLGSAAANTDASATNIYLDNTLVHSGAVFSGFVTNTSVSAILVNQVDADVACLLLYNANHDDATREAIQSILAARFGITLAS